ncbi:MAG: dienelactone hydrolase family protein, partial [Anaerolineaceae bacterium]|nr:dienelactone hydrolase family protein [Anaerolineaceae bacterium]
AGSVPVLMPVPRLPEPTGDHPVGTTSFYWVDEDRDEIYVEPDDGGNRRMMVQVWYPAEVEANAETAPYLAGLTLAGETIARKLGGAPFLFSHLDLVHTNSYLDIPLSAVQSSYPVLVFSHGWTGYRAQNTYQMEELASHGYIVFAPDHTYGALVTVFPDQDVILTNFNALPSGVSDEEYNRAARILGETWAGDIHFVLDQITLLNSGGINSQFTGHLDMELVGILGHSTGGGAAVETCWSDERCQAGLAMDAWLEPYAREMNAEGLKIPFMFMESETWNQKEDDENPQLFDLLFKTSQADVYLLDIAGTRHYDFADIPLLTPLASMIGFKGPIDGRRVLQINNAYSLAFFDLYLKNKSDVLLTGASDEYPEVTFIKK